MDTPIASRPDIMWSQAVTVYLAQYSPLHHAPATLRRIRGILGMLREDLQRQFGREDCALSEITREKIECYQIAQNRARSSFATINAHLRHLRAFFRWAEARAWIPSDPTRGIRLLKIPKRDRVLSDQQIAAMGDWLDRNVGTRWGDMLRLDANTGLRLGELLYLRTTDVDLEGRRITIRSTEEHPTKTREERGVPINDLALEILRRAMLAAGRTSGALLWPSGVGTAIDARQAHRVLKRAARSCGVPPANWYWLRHTFATRMAAHVTEAILATILGNTDQTAARFYIHHQRLDLPTPPPIGQAH